ncbi:uncharacterized protein LOC125420540 [Ziziphus jujuba]|uniref:Uncharacterized protein LOC125420540 n=1 Tax=Ziziphus jujuba TaxID=326968 RepID=A0ABM3ZWR3_ZIZJJ|nr:uncharacterized protein LOC125420540 [Ziziphus jujuba]
MEAVNSALLCKLGSLLESNQNQLWVRSLKAKYFPSSSFMRSNRKKTNSWQWKGILSIRPILAKSMCFRVGKGNNINFWKAPLIPNNPNFKPTPNQDAPPHSFEMVDSLCLENGNWNLQRLTTLFDSYSVSNIQKIFWATNSMEDEVIWLGNPSGNFQVKTVYKFLHPQETQQGKWWYHFWNSGFHERLKILHVETLLSRITIARALWLATPWSIRWEGFNLTSLETHLDWLANPRGKLPIHPDDGSKFFLFAVVVLETLWSLRNIFLFEGTRISLDLEVKSIFGKFNEFHSAMAEHIAPPNAPSTISRSWSPPLQGVIKLNTDASMGNGFASLGVVARDQAGNIIKINVTRELIDFPESAEAAAIHRAMLLALEAGLLIICCESDTKAVIQKLNNQNGCSVHWATVGFIKEIIDLCPRTAA